MMMDFMLAQGMKSDDLIQELKGNVNGEPSQQE
jgi:hypothetical protein